MEKTENILNGQEIDAAPKGVMKDSGDEEDSLTIKLWKPYRFEGKEYKEIDLSGMEEMDGSDMIAVNKIMERSFAGGGAMPEVSIEYAFYFAARAAKLPVEFFMGLNPKDAIKVKKKVMGFLFGEG